MLNCLPLLQENCRVCLRKEFSWFVSVLTQAAVNCAGTQSTEIIHFPPRFIHKLSQQNIKNKNIYFYFEKKEMYI